MSKQTSHMRITCPICDQQVDVATIDDYQRHQNNAHPERFMSINMGTEQLNVFEQTKIDISPELFGIRTEQVDSIDISESPTMADRIDDHPVAFYLGVAGAGFTAMTLWDRLRQ